MAPTVVFENVSKKFRRGERHDSLRDLIPSVARGLFRRQRSEDLSSDEFWAVRNVSFEVAPGEALGIIGPNGAGKSTTLKVLTRILKPTFGHAVVRGRVGALIEVAAGFHPDLTGRENVYLQGAIMGMKRVDIAKRFDQIVDFAGVNQFIDTPVKRYSSGMNARLGFSIAAHLEPDALIIDEVLSVGDMAFQQRCIERMAAFRTQGVAMVFVSHNLAAVASLCERSVFLSRGELAFVGSTTQATQRYLESTFKNESSGSRSSHFSRVALTDMSGQLVTEVQPGAALRLEATAHFVDDAIDVTFGLVVHQATSGIYCYGVNSGALGIGPQAVRAGSAVDIAFDFSANLTRGLYLIELHAATASTMTIHARSYPAAMLRVEEGISSQGVANLEVRWRPRHQIGEDRIA